MSPHTQVVSAEKKCPIYESYTLTYSLIHLTTQLIVIITMIIVITIVIFIVFSPSATKHFFIN